MADLALTFTPTELQNFRTSQYVSAAGLVVLLWDHFLTFHDEVELIWRARSTFPKLLFLFNRYVVPASLIILTHATSGFSEDILSDLLYVAKQTKRGLHTDFLQSCQTWFGVIIVVGMVSIATSNFLILLRLWVLWDRKTRLVLVTLPLFLVTQITAIVCTTYVVSSMMPLVVFEPYLHSCILTQKVNFVILWTPGIVFEIMIFITTWWNALDQPLPQHAKMAKVMYRDGSIYFFVLFGLRLLNLIVSIVSPLSLMFLGVFFIWSACNVTLTRLIINLRRAGAEAEESLFADAHTYAPRSWPLLPRQGSCVSENYELQGKSPDIEICTRLSSVTSITT
ncbi:hypothetical protein DFJ58DRAFT_724593 [Suillus subalutaceus]|uniref:uncharacterized protein n=1 Tax=Suillus subalutaceus TaxID=48586 RepID=UPI001B8794DD|nr:uncharacterized protein DFJ58DRAFT_724593 [Suillus subalutaceus]KAG1865044.1 hypothetical protein DFJ58DRAFT_724593 [Suillus subalutaceus]